MWPWLVSAAVLGGIGLAVAIFITRRDSKRAKALAARPKTAADLLHAADKGRCDDVRAAIKQGVSVEVTDPEGRTPLHLACIKGHEDVVRMLVDEFHANMNATDHRGYMPIHVVCGATMSSNSRSRYVQISEFLLQRGAMVNAKSRRGFTPLYWAVKNGRYEMVDVLLKHRANVNLADNEGYTPMFWAKSTKALETMLKLEQAGATT